MDGLLHQLGALLLAAPPTTPAAHTNGFTAGSIWDLVVKGGWVMLPLAVCSFFALAIAVERLVLLRRSRVAPASLVDSIPELAHDPARGLERLSRETSPLGVVLTAAARHADEPRETRDRLVDEAGQREVLKLRHRMRVMGALPQVATMLGLLGTVVGMIRTFTVVAASGESLGKTEKLAQGIYEAWTATAAGLVIAIPAMIAYHAIMGRIDGAAAALDEGASEFARARESGRRGSPAAQGTAAPQDVSSVGAGSMNGVPAVAV